MRAVASMQRGLQKGLSTTWELAKVVFPTYLLITILQATGVIPWLARLFGPAMSLFGLPGEAAVPLFLGYVLNLYAAIAAIIPLGLEPRQITLIAIMLGLAHSLILETAVAKKTGVRVTGLLLLRLGGSILVGIALNWVLP